MPLQLLVDDISAAIFAQREQKKRGGISAEPHDSKSMDPDQILLWKNGFKGKL